MCDGLGRQFSYSCPNTTLFQQRMLICDHWYMVNCSTSEADYSANLLIGQKGKKFVDDSDEKTAYHRTPRPDLLSHPSVPEYNIIYRRGKAYAGSSSNLIGVETDFDPNNNGSKSTTDEPSYNVPSHWSTEYSKYATTNKPARQNDFANNERRKPAYKPFRGSFSFNRAKSTTTTTTAAPEEEEDNGNHLPSVNFESKFRATTPQYPKVVDFVTPLPPGDQFGLLPPKEQEANAAEPQSDEVQINFASNFKATTPQYPKVVDFTTPEPPAEEIGLLPPVGESLPGDEVQINFQSNFKATTPQYPKVVDFVTPIPPGDELGLLPPHSENEVQINFDSNFKATTPVYPKAVDLPYGDEFGLLPPLPSNPENIPRGFELPKSEPTEPEAPSKFYQPPRFDPDYKNRIHRPEAATQQSQASELANSEQRWKDLRQIFLIPDYQFPLETGSRTGYDGKLSSFQVDMMGRRVNKK